METLFILGIIAGIVFAIRESSEGKKREIGETTGGLLGFFLGLIGLIIVLCSRRLPEEQEVEYYQEPLSVPEEIKSLFQFLKKLRSLKSYWIPAQLLKPNMILKRKNY
jgi:hypothetical protein